MKQVLRWAAFAVALFCMGEVFAQEKAQPKLQTELLILTTQSGEHHFTVEVALTEKQREAGLMFRETLKANEGMLFLEAEGDEPRVLTMWMKNTKLPLDMVFIESSGRVASIRRNATPYRLDPISSGVPVKAVLELAAGTAKAIQLKIGDRVKSARFE